MEADFIAKIVMAVAGGIGLIVVGVIKVFLRKPKEEPVPQQQPPPSGPQPAPSHDLILAIRSMEQALQRLDAHAQEQAKSDAREGVLDAETRRLVADIASALQALVNQLERDRVAGERDRADMKQELRRISDLLGDLRADLRRRSSRPG